MTTKADPPHPSPLAPAAGDPPGRTGSPGAGESPTGALAPRRTWSKGADFAVPLLFMGSGAAGLIYQVVWTRDLVLVFGNTTQAIVTTVTAFLGGLGIGALIGAWLGRRLRRPLAVYGFLELAVACLALLMPLAFDAIATLFRSAYLSLPSGEVALIRFLLTFVALAPVTVIMGMTLPILTRHLVRSDPDVGSRIARLYGLNTLGAVLGTFVSGFLLIGLLGLRATTWVAVALNAGAGAGALAISRTVRAGADRAPAGPATEPATESGGGRRRGARLSSRQLLILAMTFVSGLVSLALEILWTRVLVQATGSSIYIFASVLGTFLSGIAVGSLAYERVKERRAPSVTTLGGCFVAAACLALLPMVVSNINGPHALGVTVPLIFPVTAILGFAFPLSVRLFVEDAEAASRGVGVVYAANTAGCVVGAVAAGFLLVPTLGANASIVTLCIAQAAIGALLAVLFAPGRRALTAAIGIALVAAIGVTLAVPAVRLTYIQQQLARSTLAKAHFEDNVASIDVVGGPANSRRLYVNGIGITRLTIDTKLLAYIPKALRPAARSNLVICFGMGTTFRSSLILGMRTDAVELDPTVPRVMSWFYPDAAKYLDSPIGHVVTGDGRNYVRLTNKHYDIVTIDAPPPVWSAGTVVLMTHEFYEEASQRLNPGGVVVAFLPYAGVSEMKLFLRTFRASFRYMTVIRGPRPYGFYSIGSDRPLVFDKAITERIFGTPAARVDLANAPDYPQVPVASWPSVIAKQVWLVNGQVDAFAGPGPLLTDDHPISEYYLVH